MQEREIKETARTQSIPQNTISDEKEKKQTVSLPDLGLSSVLGILTHEPSNNEEQPIKRPKKRNNLNGGSEYK